MNKQELIHKLKNNKFHIPYSEYEEGYNKGLDIAILILNDNLNCK